MAHWVQSFYELLGRLVYPHPIHPTQAHMVIGLLTGAMFFALVSFLYKNKASLNPTAYHTVSCSPVFSFCRLSAF